MFNSRELANTLTETIRHWYWTEYKPYDVCKELVAAFSPNTPTALVNNITIAVIEGRKDIADIVNEQLILTDGSAEIRTMTDRNIEMSHDEIIDAIRYSIEHNGISFVDAAYTDRIGQARIQCVKTADQCRTFFTEPHALHLFDEPETIYEASLKGLYSPNSPEFWANIRLASNARSTEQTDPEPHTPAQAPEEPETPAVRSIVPQSSAETVCPDTADEPAAKKQTVDAPPPIKPETSPDSYLVIGPDGTSEEFEPESDKLLPYLNSVTLRNDAVVENAVKAIVHQRYIVFRVNGDGTKLIDAVTYDPTSIWTPADCQKNSVWRYAYDQGVMASIPERYF